jgi:hypothetical protein
MHIAHFSRTVAPATNVVGSAKVAGLQKLPPLAIPVRGCYMRNGLGVWRRSVSWSFVAAFGTWATLTLLL